MSDGKRALKSDVVIQSIKPQRPEFSPEKKHVPVKIVLQEWDKLDCYYRGQILKLKKKVKSASSSTETRKSSNKSSSTGGGNNNHKSNKSNSLPRRRSTSGHQLTELFGDENLQSDHELDGEDPNQRGSDEENKRPLHNRHRSSSRKNKSGGGGDVKITKSEKNKSSELPKPPKAPEPEDNFLSVPRDNFVIEFAIGEKKRTPIRLGPDPPGFISPVKVEPYKPPVAIGFNVVHIQKILYHSGTVTQHPSPTTTTATTPEKPPNIQPTSPTLLISNHNSDQGTTLTGNKSSSSSSYGLGNRQPQPQQKVTLRGVNSTNKGTTSTTTTTNSISKNNATSSSKGADDDDNAITSTSLSTKRKLEHRSVPETIHNIYKCHNNATTTTMTGDSTSPPNTKKPAMDKDSLLLREKMPPPPPVVRRAVTEIRHHHHNNNAIQNITPSSNSPLLKSGESITDKIIQKARELPPELKERDRRRKIECQRRRAYAHQKIVEQVELDSVDVSLKAMEMIWNLPLLSPIRSP